MKITKTNIRRSAIRYLQWLEDQQWFQLNIHNKTEWLTPIHHIISKSVDCPASLWDAVVDHWHATNWDEDSFPRPFEELYDLVDEYRTEKGITSTAQFASTH